MDNLLAVEDFCEYIGSDLDGFIDEVASEVSGRFVTDTERKAMRESYRAVSSMMREAINKRPGLAGAQIGRINLKFEYRLPSAPAWCDLVVLGKGKGKKQVFIIELKNWFATDDSPGIHEGLITHQGSQWQHPSDQVGGYVEYCRNFHSAVMEDGANVSGCVYFTTETKLAPYQAGENEELAKTYPLFNLKTQNHLAELVGETVEEGDPDWGAKFINGIYCQNRSILEQVAKTFRENNTARPFVLLDEQRRGLNLVMSVLDECVRDQDRKQVIIVEGPPGSGKSAVAVNLWAEAVGRFVGEARRNPGNVIFVSTNTSQKDNWSAAFNEFSGIRAADGFILAANSYNPGMKGADMEHKWIPIFGPMEGGKLLTANGRLRFDEYEFYTNWMLANGMADHDYEDNHHFLSIVDEAHALINSAKPDFKTNKMAGWCFQMGPQAYHIIRKSRVSVFFIDPKQSFRDNESTTDKDIEDLGKHLGANVSRISLAGMQFRCAGSVDYVNFVDHLFDEQPLLNHSTWASQFALDVDDTPNQMTTILGQNVNNGKTVRLLSTYTVKWVSRGMNGFHEGNYVKDFCIKVKEDGSTFERFWNTEAFVRAPKGSVMSVDPLSEIGCPYMVRGYDYDYVGILSLGDIVWRNGRWMVDYSKCEETATGCSKSAALKEIKRMKIRGNLFPLHCETYPVIMAHHNSIIQAYRILLTRAIRGVRLYIRDPETREHIRELLVDGV